MTKTPTRIMNVVILTSHYNTGANLAVQTFLAHRAHRRHNIQVVGIVSGASYAANWRGIQNMRRLIRNTGWRFAMKIIGYNLALGLWTRAVKWLVPDRYRRSFEMEELAEQYGIPYYATKNVNADATHAWIQQKKPDYLVSALCMQIVKPKLLTLPGEGAINFHPALTQNHRGSFSAFWTLLKQFRHGGATVHHMTPRLDDGEVIVQRRFFVKRSDSMDCLNRRAAKLGGQLLMKALIKLQKKEKRARLVTKLGALFTHPDRQSVEKFETKGHKLFHFDELFRR